MTSRNTYHLRSLTVKTATWTRDSHGLFDFDTKQTVKNFIKCTGPGVICRINDECILDKGVGEGALVTVTPVKTEEWVVRSTDNSSKLWVVVKSLRYGRFSGHLLAEGDLIKLGRERFKVNQISADGAAVPKLPSQGVIIRQPDTPAE
jgi:hypothetical protein